jgi:hypothetical protein
VRDTITNTYRYANADLLDLCDSDTNGSCYTHGNGYGDTYSCCKCDGNRDADIHTYCNIHRYANNDSFCYAYDHTQTNTNGQAERNTEAATHAAAAPVGLS